MLEIIGEVVRRSELQDAHVRPIITRGFGGPGIDPRLCPEPTLIVSAYPFPPFLGADPIKLFTSAIVRKAPRSLGAHVKSLNYLDAIVAKQQAGELGMHDAVMLDSLGAVAECTGANLFIVVGDTLVTPDDARRAARASRAGRCSRSPPRRASTPRSATSGRWSCTPPTARSCAAPARASCRSAPSTGARSSSPHHPLIERIQDAYRARTRAAAYRTELYIGAS